MEACADVFWANARKKFQIYKKRFYGRKYLKEDRDSKSKTKAHKDEYAANVEHAECLLFAWLGLAMLVHVLTKIASYQKAK